MTSLTSMTFFQVPVIPVVGLLFKTGSDFLELSARFAGIVNVTDERERVPIKCLAIGARAVNQIRIAVEARSLSSLFALGQNRFDRSRIDAAFSHLLLQG